MKLMWSANQEVMKSFVIGKICDEDFKTAPFNKLWDGESPLEDKANPTGMSKVAGGGNMYMGN